MRKTVKQKFIASVQDDYMDQIEQIADELRTRGCEIKEILSVSGVITGRIKAQVRLDDLRVKGIASIEKERVVRKQKISEY